MNPIDLARTVVDVLADKKGENILLLDISKIAFFTDYFVICSGTSDRMLRALSLALEEQLHQQYHIPVRTEGNAEGGWLLLDLGDVVVHLFSPEQRVFYDLEELWSDGKVVLHLQ